MTNVLVGLTIIRFLTNSGATTVCSDGKGGICREQRYVVSAEVSISPKDADGQAVPYNSAIIPWSVYAKTWTPSTPPLPPPLPLRTKPMRQTNFTPSSSLTDPGMLLSAASVIEPDCECPFFRVSFTAHTNRIYSFQRSRDLMTWELRPPEVDGEEGVMGFFDVFEGGAMYRIASREGVLPP